MSRVLRERFIGLGRDEDGAALVITLAVFMFIYLLFIGIWAVGTNVRTRIHLQNACDAAAYSAAVVQADTLSRIATINRAMSWTYVQMTRRQMDWVVKCWLVEACNHWRDDRDRAIKWAEESTAECGVEEHITKTDYEIDQKLKLYFEEESEKAASESDITSWCQEYVNLSWCDDATKESFFADKDSITSQITEDWKAVAAMNVAIAELAEQFSINKIDGIAEAIVQANLDDESVTVEAIASNMKDYVEVLETKYENRFVDFCGEKSVGDAFGLSAAWFEQKETDRGFRRGFHRGYERLRATWSWYSRQWHCKEECSPPSYGSCAHTGHARCSCSQATDGKNYASVYADNSASWDERYETPTAYTAKPLVLKLAYFGKDGTITVGLKAKNQNPWGWMGDVSKGIFSAFDPFVTNTFCVASAKAGYRDFGAGKTYGRDYQIDWRSEERWNLYTSDWDAVLVPVPRAASMAQGGVWENDVGDEMPDALSGIAGKLGFSASDFRAGGQHDYQTAFSQDGYSWDEYLDLSNADYVKAGGAVRAKWQVRNPGGVLGRWEKIQKRMWH